VAILPAKICSNPDNTVLWKLKSVIPKAYAGPIPVIGEARTVTKMLSWLRKTAEKKGLPYQSLVNDILASEMRKAS
jgi:hypothetical protein